MLATRHANVAGFHLRICQSNCMTCALAMRGWCMYAVMQVEKTHWPGLRKSTNHLSPGTTRQRPHHRGQPESREADLAAPRRTLSIHDATFSSLLFPLVTSFGDSVY